MNFPGKLPRRLWRFPTWAARESLAARFALPLDEGDQDWEWTHSRPEQLDEYLAAYQGGELSDDERFTLTEMMVQCVENEADESQRAEVLRLIEANIELHLQTVWYWACLDADLEDSWEIAPTMRAIWEQHRALWE